MTTDPFTDAACDEAAKRWPYEPAPSVLSGARRRDRRLGFLVGAKWGRTYIERCIRALHAADADGNCGHCTRGRVYPVPAPCETVRALAKTVPEIERALAVGDDR